MGNIVFPTKRQRETVNFIVQGESVSSAMRKAGYTPSSAKNPKYLTERKGFRQLCEENGLTDNLLLKSLVDDIKAKPQNRKAELELGFKIKGHLVEKDERRDTFNTIIFTDERVAKIARRVIAGYTKIETVSD